MLASIVSRLQSIPGMASSVVIGSPAQMESLGSSPHIWITDVSESGGDSPVLGPVRQRILMRIEVTSGARTLNAMTDLRDAIRSALVNYCPNNAEPIKFGGGRMEFLDPGWVLWRDDFLTAYFYETR